ncbi:MAG: YggS family pyridoxal phosphate-dependent enzyme [Bacteroidales bacterium]|nr:YggS family pyridoxal phosphate-dependent enzyme [Bacteroidales bacterium]
MSTIKANIVNFKNQLPKHIKLVAVSKTHPIEMIKEAYSTGQKHFGENRVQELIAKQEELKDLDIKWHLIGHLQRNKVKYIASFVDLIHSVDSLKLLKEINKQAINNSRTINCLLQFHIASEDTKFGLNIDEATELLESEEFKKLTNVKIVGVMGMASFTENETQVRSEFLTLHEIFNQLKNSFFNTSKDFEEISMGMSNDWEIAINSGSTMIRVGSVIFGNRNCSL